MDSQYVLPESVVQVLNTRTKRCTCVLRAARRATRGGVGPLSFLEVRQNSPRLLGDGDPKQRSTFAASAIPSRLARVWA